MTVNARPGIFRAFTLLLLTMCTVVGPLAHAGQQPTTPAAAPRAEPVIVDFYLVAADGTPVGDLRNDELTIRVNGRARPLADLRWVRSSPLPAAEDQRRERTLPPPYGSNLISDLGRTLVIVIDDDSFRPGREQPIREALRGFLGNISGRDRIALATLPYGGLKVDFTTQHERVATALAGLVGQAPQELTGSDLACRTRRTLDALVGLLNSLGGGVGPTAVLFVSSGLAAPRRDAPMTMAPGMCELTTEHFAQVVKATASARASFYVIQPEDVVLAGTRQVENIAGAGFAGSDNPLAGLEHLTGVTGGHRLPLLTARNNNLIRIARETSGYYAAAFVPEPNERNGNSHTLDIRVSRPDVTVRARPAVVIPRPVVRGARVPSPRDMLRETRVFRDLPLRTAAYPSQNDAKSVKLLAVIESPEPGVKLTAVAAGLIDAKGNLFAQWTANAEELAVTPLMTALVARQGRYRLRIAATDSTGRGGSADYDVDAELIPAGTLNISSLVLGLSRGGFRPMLQFGTEPVALAYLEMYGKTAEPPTVTVEIATSEDGPAVLTMPGAIAPTKDDLLRVATAALPIGSLPAGDYIVRAIINADGQQARVVRTLRKQSR
jgi:VWFA-related protein